MRWTGTMRSALRNLHPNNNLHAQAAEEAADAVDWDDAVGISMPLYTLVDVLFELQSRGFFRRQAGHRLRPVSGSPVVLQGGLSRRSLRVPALWGM